MKINLILILTLNIMQKIITLQEIRINNKNYLVPQFNLFGCQQYMLPKLDNAPVHHTFFAPNDIQQLYRQQNIDPDQLECNLNQDLQVPTEAISQASKSSKANTENTEPVQSLNQNNHKAQKIFQKPQRQRPKLRETGFTHFISIPLEQQIGDIYDNLIKPQIQQENLDCLVGKKSLHATILTFRIRSLDDVPKWQKIIKSVNLKKAKVSMKGVDIFPVKKTYTQVVYLNINGLDDIIDTVVSKAIEQKLVNEKELQHIYFDKQSETFKMEKQHVTLLKTKGDDLIDGAPYLKNLGKTNLGKITLKKIALCVIGSFDQKEGYFNEFVHQIE